MKIYINCFFAAIAMFVVQSTSVAQLDYDSSTIDFGTVCVGGPTSSLTLELTNNTGAQIILQDVGVVGQTEVALSPEGFAATGGQALQPGAKANITVFFQAQNSGPVTGELTFTVDGAPNSVPLAGAGNEAPTAVAVVQKLVDVGGNTVLRLDGTGSDDFEDDNSSLMFHWRIKNLATGETDFEFLVDEVEQIVDCGTAYHVTLMVTDTCGESDTATKTVSVGDPCLLTSLDKQKVKVYWNKTPGSVKISGEIGLPAGVYPSDVYPMVSLRYLLANETLFDDLVFPNPNSDGRKWKLHDHDVVNGIHKLDIDWKGARYDFKEKGFPVQIKSEVIASSETVLTIKLKNKEIDSPFSISFNGAASVAFDADGNVSSATTAFNEEKPGKEVSVTLPFPLDAASTIAIAGGLNRSLSVANDLKDSVGRFRLDLRFDASSFVDGIETTPLKSDLQLWIGEDGYFGQSIRDESNGLKIKKNYWEAK